MRLTEQNYFSREANLYYMSASQITQLHTCESQGLAIILGLYEPTQTIPQLVGSYVDAYFSGTLNRFKNEHEYLGKELAPEGHINVFTMSGDLSAQFKHAEKIIARIKQDKLFMSAISGKTQVIMTGEIEGIPVKIKIDSMLPDRTNDLKIIKDFDSIWSAEDGMRVPWWQYWRYDIQGGIYQNVRSQNESGIIKPFGIAAATKEKPEPDLGLFEFSQQTLDNALDEVRGEIVYYDSLKKGLFEPESCGKCAWCRSQKKLTGWEEIG
jgi:hypothetical protein